jgi:hypothetical protein
MQNNTNNDYSRPDPEKGRTAYPAVLIKTVIDKGIHPAAYANAK